MTLKSTEELKAGNDKTELKQKNDEFREQNQPLSKSVKKRLNKVAARIGGNKESDLILNIATQQIDFGNRARVVSTIRTRAQGRIRDSNISRTKLPNTIPKEKFREILQYEGKDGESLGIPDDSEYFLDNDDSIEETTTPLQYEKPNALNSKHYTVVTTTRLPKHYTVVTTKRMPRVQLDDTTEPIKKFVKTENGRNKIEMKDEMAQVPGISCCNREIPIDTSSQGHFNMFNDTENQILEHIGNKEKMDREMLENTEETVTESDQIYEENEENDEHSLTCTTIVRRNNDTVKDNVHILNPEQLSKIMDLLEILPESVIIISKQKKESEKIEKDSVQSEYDEDRDDIIDSTKTPEGEIFESPQQEYDRYDTASKTTHIMNNHTQSYLDSENGLLYPQINNRVALQATLGGLNKTRKAFKSRPDMKTGNEKIAPDECKNVKMTYYIKKAKAPDKRVYKKGDVLHEQVDTKRGKPRSNKMVGDHREMPLVYWGSYGERVRKYNRARPNEEIRYEMKPVNDDSVTRRDGTHERKEDSECECESKTKDYQSVDKRKYVRAKLNEDIRYESKPVNDGTMVRRDRTHERKQDPECECESKTKDYGIQFHKRKYERARNEDIYEDGRKSGDSRMNKQDFQRARNDFKPASKTRNDVKCPLIETYRVVPEKPRLDAKKEKLDIDCILLKYNSMANNTQTKPSRFRPKFMQKNKVDSVVLKFRRVTTVKS